MRTMCWSVKGGSGTTVAATAIALLAARGVGEPAVLVDLAGDVSTVLGLPRPEFGVDDWLVSPDSVGISALDGLAIDACPGLRLIPGSRDHGSPRASRIATLVQWLRSQPGAVVIDLGVRLRRDPVADAIADCCDRSLLVTRPCYLALRLAADAPYRPSGIVLIREKDRSLDAVDVEASAGAPVVATIDVHPAIARAVDAGLLNTRLPRPLTRALRRAA